MNYWLRDRGSATTEYTAGVVLVAAIAAVAFTSDVGSQISNSFSSTTCRIVQNCEPRESGLPQHGWRDNPQGDESGRPQHGWRDNPQPRDSGLPQHGWRDNPQPGDSGRPQHGWPDDEGPPPIDEIPAEREFNAAMDAADTAEQRLQDVQDAYEEVDNEIQGTDSEDGFAPKVCIMEGALAGCMELGKNLTPPGEAWHPMSEIPRVTKLLKRHRELLDRLREARKDRDKSAGDFRRVCGQVDGGPGDGGCGNPINERWAVTASFPEKELQEKYDRYAPDFGLPPTNSGDKAESLEAKIRDHISAPATRRYKVDHQGRMGVVFVDRDSGRMVLLRPDQTFWDAWKLQPAQIDDVENGQLPAR